MKKRHGIRTIIYFIATLLSLISTTFTEARAEHKPGDSKTIRAIIQSDSPPTYFRDRRTNEAAGFAVDVVNEIAGREGFSVTYLFEKNWAGISDMIQSGKADIAPGQGITDERQEIAAFTLPIATFQVSVFARADSAITGLKDDLTVGVTKGSSSSQIIKNKHPNIKTVSYESNSDGLMDLLSGNIDAFCTSATTLTKVAIAAGLQNKIKIVGDPLSEIKRAIALHKGNTELLDRLNRGIAEFIRTPQYREIYIKWYGNPRPYWTRTKIVYTASGFLFAAVFIMALWRHYSVLSINRDLVATKEKLKQSEIFSKTIIETEPECIKLVGPDGNLIMMNRAGLNIVEADSLEQVKGRCVSQIVAPEYRDAFTELGKRVFNGGTGMLTFEIIGLKGRHRWLETHAVPFRNEKDEIVALLGVTRDITGIRKAEAERTKAEESTEKEKERLAVTLRSIGDGVIVTDTGGAITIMNKAAEELTGWTSAEGAGRFLTDVFNIINEASREKCENPCDKVLRTGLVSGLANHTVLIRKDGSEIIIADSAAPVRDRESRVIGVVLVFRDITEKYKMEAEMQKMQKLESLGLLAGGLAHDFNNLLTGIMGNISMVKMHLDEKHQDYERLYAAEKATERAAELTQQLLTFAKGGAPVRKAISISDAVKEAVDFALHGSSVKCEYSIHQKLWNTEVDRGQMNQVFNNLTLNAIHAMADGGTVYVDFDNTTLAENQIPLLTPGNYVKISFMDEGSGIQKEHLQKIFDPYFTTKKQGSGLGLSSVFSIIRKHEGSITVESTTGAGTTFRIYLPASGVCLSKEEKLPERIQKGHEKILVMDDEEMIRDIAVNMLTRLGYEADSAESGERALELYNKALDERAPFNAVIMDLTISGGMGGKEAVKKLLELDPHAKVIVSSGYSTDPIMSDYRNYGFSGVVSKPYRIQQLSDAVTSVLNSA